MKEYEREHLLRLLSEDISIQQKKKGSYADSIIRFPKDKKYFSGKLNSVIRKLELGNKLYDKVLMDTL